MLNGRSTATFRWPNSSLSKILLCSVSSSIKNVPPKDRYRKNHIKVFATNIEVAKYVVIDIPDVV